MKPFKNWASSSIPSPNTPSISFSTAQIGDRATVGTAGESGNASGLLTNPIFRNELNTTKVAQHVVSRQRDANTAVINGTWTVDFPAKNLNKIIVRWTTIYNNANDSEAYLAFIRIRNTGGTITTIQGRIDRNTSTLLTTEIDGEWSNINRVEVGLYSYSYGEDGGSYDEDVNGYAEINMAFITAYDGIDPIPLYIQGSSSERRVCYTNNETALKFQGNSVTRNIALVDDADPNNINDDAKKMIGFQGASKIRWILGV